MRKFSLALLALLMVAAMASADPIATEWTIEAEASATFGANLDGLTTTLGVDDGPTTGFSLANDIDIEVVFVEEQDKEFGEGEMYGWIKVEELKIMVEADGSEETAPAFGGDNGEISAKVFLGPAYIVIATAENDINEADTEIGIDESILGLGDLLSEPDDGASVAIGFDVATTNIELVLASTGTTAVDGTNSDDWSDNPFNNYKGAILTETKVDALTVTLDLAAALRGHAPEAADVNETEAQGDFGDDGFVGLNISYDLPLDDMLTVVPFVGVDLFNDKAAGVADDSTSGAEGAMDYEIAIGANIEWGADDLEVFAAASDETQAGVGFDIGIGKDNLAGEDNSISYIWVRAGLAEDGGDDGMFPVIGAAVLVEYLTQTVTTGGTDADPVNQVAFGAEVDADLGEISPFFGVMYGDTNMDVDNDAGVDNEGLTLKVGTDIDIIPATTFTIEYSSGNLLNSADTPVYDATAGTYSYDAATGNANNSAGTFTIKTKVSY